MHRRALAGVLVAGLALLGAACSDDEDDTAETGSAPEEETTTTAPPEEGEAAEGGEEEDGGAPDVNPCAEGESGTFGPPTAPAEGATAVEVTATDYAFAGLEPLGATGEFAITLTNDGQELHEVAISRLADSETRPIEEILASGEEPELTDVAFAFACPGATSEPTAANLDQPGRYVVACFIPVGTTPQTDPAEFESLGPPHAAQGMIQEIVIES